MTGAHLGAGVRSVLTILETLVPVFALVALGWAVVERSRQVPKLAADASGWLRAYPNGRIACRVGGGTMDRSRMRKLRS